MAKASIEITNLPVNDLKARLDKARTHLAAIEELLPGLVSLDHDGRVHSSGRLRAGARYLDARLSASACRVAVSLDG